MRRVLRALAGVLFDPFRTLIVQMEGRLGILLRRFYYRLRLGSMGRGVRIEPGVLIANPGSVHLGDRVWIDRGVMLVAGNNPDDARSHKRLMRGPDVPPGVLRVGSRCHSAAGVVIQGHGGVSIRSDLTIAAESKIYSLSHHYMNPDDPSDTTTYSFVGLVADDRQFMISGPVVVGDNAAVCMNTILLPGSRVGENAWLAAGSVLKGEVPAGCVARGNPARMVKFRPGFERPHVRKERG